MGTLAGILVAMGLLVLAGRSLSTFSYAENVRDPLILGSAALPVVVDCAWRRFPCPSGEPVGSDGGAADGVGARRYPRRVYNSPFRQSVISEDERGGAFRSEAPFCFQQTRSPATFRRHADPPLASG